MGERAHAARVRAARAIMRRWRPRADFAEGLVAQLQELLLTALQLLALVLAYLALSAATKIGAISRAL